MNPWRPFPLLRLFFPFIAGIVAGLCLENKLPFPVWFYVPGLLLLLLLNLFPTRLQLYRLRWLPGFVIFLSLFFFATDITGFKIDSLKHENPGRDTEGWFLAEVIEPVPVRKSYLKAMVAIKCIQKDNRWLPVHGKCLLYLRSNSPSCSLDYGDFILFHASFDQLTDNANPNSFSYPKYLIKKGIRYITWVDHYAWRTIALGTTSPLRRIAFQLRNRMLELMRDNRISGREFAVAAALLLGYVDDVDTDLRNAYSATGVTHILSVSGMHVGIIFIFLEFILGFLNKARIGRIMKMIIMLGFIWFYAFLTGLSPAVLRAAATLSFIIIGKSMKRNPEMFNILAASLFFLLIIDPLLLFDIGFQLSYLAVIGIVLVYKPIYNLLITGKWIPDKLWSVMSVTLAAQLATLPVTLYYFHQFPNYFLLTNLFVVPFSTLIIYAGIAAVVFGTVPFLSLVVSKLLSWLVWVLNFFILRMEQLPASASRGIFITVPEMLMMYLIIGFAFLFVSTKRPVYVYLLIGGAICLNISFLTFKINRLGSSWMMVYHFNRTSCFEFTSQDRSILFYDLKSVRNLETQFPRDLSIIRSNWNAHGIKRNRSFWLGIDNRKLAGRIVCDQLFGDGCFFQFRDHRIGVLRTRVPAGLTSKIRLDYLIISRNPEICLSEVLNHFIVREIIIDGTNARNRIKKWRDEAMLLKIRCHVLPMDGAFIKEF